MNMITSKRNLVRDHNKQLFSEFCLAMADMMNERAELTGDRLVTPEQIANMPECHYAFESQIAISQVVANQF